MQIHKLMLTLGILLAFEANAQSIEDATEMKHENILYLVSKPKNYSDDIKHPTIIFLHGGDRSNTKHHPSKYAAKAGFNFPFIVIAPSCTGGCSWSNVDLAGILQHASKEVSIDPTRIYLTGYSMGGAGTWANMKKITHLLAAAAPLAPAGGTTKDLCTVKILPIRVYHGTADSGYRNSKNMVSALRECGAKNVELVSLEGEGHGIWPSIFSDPSFYDWMLAHRKVNATPLK